MSVKETLKRIARTALMAMAMPMVATAKPAITDDHNNFDPTYPVGIYINELSSNVVHQIVSLTNGVLTVGDETINVAEPTHTVITTNTIGGVEVVTTNVYDAVYQDGLAEELAAYAKLRKITSIVTNTVDTTVTTNWTEVAYLNDIPADSKKADKVINVYDYQMDVSGAVLARALNKDAPYAYWYYDGLTNGVTNVVLFVTNGIWNVSVNSNAYETVEGAEGDSTITFPSYTFRKVNDTRYAYVVYTDLLTETLDNRLHSYVSKTNLYSLSSHIVETNLHSYEGFATIFRGIRDEINAMADGTGIHLSFKDVGGSKLILMSPEMRIPGDSILVDWGDGTKETIDLTTTRAEHTYESGVGDVEVVITGFIRSISGALTRAVDGIFPFASFEDNINSRLVGVRVDPIVGLDEIGDYAFYGCSGLTDNLSFIPSTVTTIGNYAFQLSGITSLVGIPNAVTSIANGCFKECDGLQNLSGLSPGITSLGEEAFAQCANMTSIVGIPRGITTLGSSVFNGTPLASITELGDTGVDNIPDNCFSGTQLKSVDLSSLSVTNIGASAFANCSNLETVETGSSLVSVGDTAFGSCSKLSSVTFPSTVTTIGSSAFESAGTSASDTLTITFTDKYISEGGSSIADITNESGESSLYFGIPTTLTGALIVGDDGEYSLVSGAWQTLSTRSKFYLANLTSGSHSIALGTIEEGATARKAKTVNARAKDAFTNVKVDWGDGTINRKNTHTYSFTENTNIVINIIGKVDSISGTSGKPFIVVDGNGTNENLNAVSFGNYTGIAKIGDYSFRNCTEIECDGDATNVTGVTSIASLGKECFAGTKKITTDDFLESSSVTEYSEGCFRDSMMKNPFRGSATNRIVSLGARTFSGCTEMEWTDDDTLPSSLATIGDYSFYGCTNIENKVISDIAGTSVTEIPEGCFMNCSKITNLTNGMENVRSVGKDAFSGLLYAGEISLPNVTNIGARAFYAVGTQLDEQKTEDLLPYKLIVNMNGRNFGESATLLGLDTTGDPTSGITKNETIVNCADNAVLAYNSNTGVQGDRWEVITDALTLSLEDVPSNTTFTTQSGGVNPMQGNVSLIFNWGDGSTSGWVNGNPTNHTYTNSGTSNYIVKVKGLLGSVSSAANIGPFIRPLGSVDNPYLTGFNIPEGSSLKTVGQYSFSNCRNLKAVNKIDTSRSVNAVDLKKKIRSIRANGRSISDIYTNFTNDTREVSFGDYCFTSSGVNDLSSYPNTATNLAMGIFSNCTNLENLVGLPNTIVDMGASAFLGDTALQSLIGFPSYLTYISDNGFYGCTNLASLFGLSDSSVSSIGNYSFYGATGLQELSGLPESLKWIGKGAFVGSNIKTVGEIPNGVETISDFAFSYCTNLSSVSEYPSSITNIAYGTFLGCSSLETIGSIPEGVCSIGSFAYGLCGKVETGSVPATITNISDFAFLDLGHNIPVSVNKYGISASAIIDAKDFSCTNFIALITAHSNNNPLVAFNCRDGYVYNENDEWKAKYRTIMFSLDGVRAKTTFSFGVLVPLSTTTIDWGDGVEETYVDGLTHQYALSGNYNITLVGEVQMMAGTGNNMPVLRKTSGGNPNLVAVSVGGASGLNMIGDNCFNGCSGLKTLSGFENSGVVSFGDNCFKNCTGLTSLVGIPSSINALGIGCFDGCTSLTSIAGLPYGLNTISTNCFINCTGITTISNIPESVTLLRSGCFRNCTALNNLDGLATGLNIGLESYVFANCTSLRDISGLGTNITSLAEGLFYGCSNIVSIAGLADNMFSIPDYCFYGCSSITNLVGLPNSLEVIGNHSFDGCSICSLDGIGTNIYVFGDYAFANNVELYNINEIENNTNEIIISEGMFYGCTNLGNEAGFGAIPSNVLEIGSYAFKDCSLKNVDKLPFCCSTVGTNAFDGTSISTIVILTNNLERIGPGVFTNETGLSVSITNNIEYTRRIEFPQISTYEIVELDDFPWGASDTTLFVGNDGIVVNRKGDWISIVRTAEIEINLPNTWRYTSDQLKKNPTYVVVNGILPSDDIGILIDWGNGSFTNWVCNGESVTNAYTTFGKHIITLYRQFDSFGYSTNVGAKPVVYRASGYYSSFEVNKVRIYDESGCYNIGDYAMYNVLALSEFPEMPQSVTNIGSYAFYNTKIYSLTNLPLGVVSLGSDVFRRCQSLTNVVLSSSNLIGIPDECFYEASAVSNIYINASSMVSVGDKAMYSLKDIKSIDLTNTSVADIGDNAFGECVNLRYLTIPSTITNISSIALSNVGVNLSNIVDDDNYKTKAQISILGKTCNWVVSNLVVNVNSADGMFNAPTSAKFICEDGDIVWNGSKWIINYGKFRAVLDVTAGKSFSVVGISTKESLTWNWGDGTVIYNVTNASDIGSHTYLEDGLYNVTIRGKISSITGLNDKPFLCCEGETGNAYVKSIDIREADSNFSIGDYALTKCTSLNSVEINATCKSIGSYSFYGCSSLERFSIPKSCSYVGSHAFDGCSSLSVVDVNNNSFIPSYGTNALSTASGVTINFTDGYCDIAYISVTNGICPNIYSKINAFDGMVEYEDGRWIVKSKAITARTYIGQGGLLRFRMPEMVSKKDSFVIDWGDGNRETVSPGSRANKTYVLISSLTPNGIQKEYVWKNYLSVEHAYNSADRKTYKTIRIIGDIAALLGYVDLDEGFAHKDYCGFIYGVKHYLGSLAFDDTYVESVVIGNLVKPLNIGVACFATMGHLNDISFEDTQVKSISSYAFYASGLERIPKFKDNTIKSLPDHCFSKCDGIKTLVGIPEGVEKLGDYCFGINHWRSSSDGVITDSGERVDNLTSLEGMPNTITTFGEGCFSGQENITSLRGCSTNLVEIGDYCFFGCNIDSLVAMPSSVNKIGKASFRGCNLTSLSGLSSNIETIPEQCFYENKIISFLGMPNNIKYLGALSLTPYYGKNLVGLSSNIVSIGDEKISGYFSKYSCRFSALAETPNLQTLDGLPKGVASFPCGSFRGSPKSTFLIPSWVKSVPYYIFNEGTTLLLEGRSGTDIYQDLDGCGSLLWRKGVNYSPWEYGSIIWGELSENKNVFVNGSTYQYAWSQQHNNVTYRGSVGVQRSEPYLRATLAITKDNVTINIGTVTLYDSETPVVWDWGDGNVEWLIGKVPSSHTYSVAGKYDIKVTTLARAIGGYRETGPFISVGTSSSNPYLTEFGFSDSVGLTNIGITCFRDCENLSLISCDSTVYGYVHDNGGYQGFETWVAPTVILKNSSYTSKQIKNMSGYPWGWSSHTIDLKVCGIDADFVTRSDYKAGTYMRFSLLSVPHGTRIRLYPYKPKGTKRLEIRWGDGEKSEYMFKDRYSVDGRLAPISHSYDAANGDTKDYTIFVGGEADGLGPTGGLAGENGEPTPSVCMFQTLYNTVELPNPYLSEVTIGENLAITNIGKYAFANCPSLKSIIYGGDSLKSIDDYSFYNTGITDFGKIPASVKYIGTMSMATNTETDRKIELETIDDMTIATAAFGTNTQSTTPSIEISIDDTNNFEEVIVKLPTSIIKKPTVVKMPEQDFTTVETSGVSRPIGTAVIKPTGLDGTGIPNYLYYCYFSEKKGVIWRCRSPLTSYAEDVQPVSLEWARQNVDKYTTIFIYNLN